jgi:hypothetical protein
VKRPWIDHVLFVPGGGLFGRRITMGALPRDFFLTARARACSGALS